MNTLIQKIELYKVRTFGDMLSDTFNFVRQNFKPLFKGLFYIVTPALLLMAIFGMNYYKNTMGMMVSPVTAYDPYVIGKFIGIMLPMSLFAFIGTVLLTCVTFSYIKLYAEDKEREISTAMLWQTSKKYFWKLVGLDVVLGIAAIIVVVVFSFIIGIFMVALTASSSVTVLTGIFAVLLVFAFIVFIICFIVKTGFASMFIVVKDRTVFEAISESWRFTKGIFWKVFGFILVLGLLTGIISYAFLLPGYVVLIVQTFMNSTLPSGIPSLASALLALGAACATLVYSINIAGKGIFYFSETEKREGINLQKQIDEIGKREE